MKNLCLPIQCIFVTHLIGGRHSSRDFEYPSEYDRKNLPSWGLYSSGHGWGWAIKNTHNK